jgi:uncharacterized protein (TIGR00725 family)
MRKPIIGVMGSGDKAREVDIKTAFELGSLIAQQNWVLLSGGRNNGVMDAVNKGANSSGGLTIGVMPTKDNDLISEAVDIAIITDMGSARNNINVLSSDVVVACGIGGAGTASEIALALKSNKPVILLNNSDESRQFFRMIGGMLIHEAKTARQTIEIAASLVTKTAME